MECWNDGIMDDSLVKEKVGKRIVGNWQRAVGKKKFKSSRVPGFKD
jgi:hypothetical protein